jgi:hypothetical protein
MPMLSIFAIAEAAVVVSTWGRIADVLGVIAVVIIAGGA